MSIFRLFICLLSLVSCTVSSGINVKKLIQFKFISENYSAQSYNVDNLEKILRHPKFDWNKQTAIYSYGFTRTAFQPSVRNIVDAYLENGKFNFLLIDYNSILSYTFINADQFADKISNSLLKLFNAGYGNFHLIGFSLGGQIAAAVGRYVFKKSLGQHKIPRITGLDPAQVPPFFSYLLSDFNDGVATFVDTIHCESESFGNRNSLGNASFWVNGGISQPICDSSIGLIASICSHLQAPKFWAESVRSKNPQNFPSKRCSSYNDFTDKKCEEEIEYMGIYVNQNSSGRFYLDANLDRTAIS